MQAENKIPFLEKPNIEEINNNIKESGLVLCLALNEQESVSLVSPSYYYIYVQRYMYLCNIIPQCLEYFKSFVLPFYGNKCGVYFECIQNKNINNNSDNNRYSKIESEKIILDWRLPIGVLFDIYCDIENENMHINETEQNFKFCSNNELFPDYVNILKVSCNEINNSNNLIINNINDNTEDGYTLHNDEKRNSTNYNSEVQYKSEIGNELNKENGKNFVISKIEFPIYLKDKRETDELLIKDSSENIDSIKVMNGNHRIKEKDMEINIIKKNKKGKYKSKEELFQQPIFQDTQDNNLEFDRNVLCKIKNYKKLESNKFCENKENKKEIYEKNVNVKSDSKYYKLIMKKEINNEWYEKQFLNISNKNIPWKLIVHFQGEKDYPYFNSEKNEKKSYNGNINVLSYNSCIPLYKGFNDFEEYIINQLKKANYIFNKNSRVLQMLPQNVEKNFLFHLKNFNVENICSIYREYIDYNMIKFIDYFNNEFVHRIKYFLTYDESTENNVNEGNKKREETYMNWEKYKSTNHKNMEFYDKIEENIQSENNVKENILKKNDYTNDKMENQTNDSNFMQISDSNITKNNIKNNCINNANSSNYSNNNSLTNTDNIGLHFEKKKEQNKDNLLLQDISKETCDNIRKTFFQSSCNYTREKCSLYEILKDEKLVKEVPIIIHIYGPPYNQIITKSPLFKIIYSEKNKNIIEEFFMYTLGDFLHEQFPSFFRKIRKKEKKILGKEKVDMENKDVGDKVEVKRAYYDKNVRLNMDEKKSEKNMCGINSETVSYFIEDDFLIFSEYIFIIINGIQIPLKTPLYWLTMNFSQFDNFLHIILRIPPY